MTQAGPGHTACGAVVGQMLGREGSRGQLLTLPKLLDLILGQDWKNRAAECPDCAVGGREGESSSI